MSLRERILDVVEQVTGQAIIPRQVLQEAVREFQEFNNASTELAYNALDYFAARPQEMRPERRQRLAQRARTAFTMDPLAAREIEMLSDFAFGKGVGPPQCADTDVQEIVDDAWEDPSNLEELTGFGAQRAMAADLRTQGTLFCLLFESAGRVRVGWLNHDDVLDVVVDPENRRRALYFLARERRHRWNPHTNTPEIDTVAGPAGLPRALYYAHWRNLRLAEEEREANPKLAELPQIDPQKLGAGVVYRLAINRLGEQHFGVSPFARSLRFLSAMNQFVEARVAMAQAASQFIAKRTIRGTPNMVRRQAESILNRSGELATREMLGSGEYERLFEQRRFWGLRQPPVPPGSIWNENESSTLTNLSLNSGAAQAAQDAQIIRAPISASSGFAQHYLGDTENANLAAACHDDQTETLTEDGWLGLPELKRRAAAGELPRIASYDPDGDCIRYETPEHGLALYEYKGPMARFKQGRRIDMLVTPNHRMLVRRARSRLSDAQPFEFIEAQHLGRGRYYSKVAAPLAGGERVETFTLPGCEIRQGRRGGGTRVMTMRAAITVSMDAWLTWLGWFIAEGSEGGCVAQSMDSRWLPEVQAACRNLGVPGIEHVKRSRGGEIWSWRPRNPRQFELWLDEHVGRGAHNKRIPAFVFALHREQQMLLLRGLMGGDGACGASKSGWELVGHSHYNTTSRALADDVQRLAFHCGFRAHVACISRYQTKLGSRESWEVRLLAPGSSPKGRRGDWIVVRKPQMVPYEGEVYCFTLPHGTLVTRRHGRIAIQGNTVLELPLIMAVQTFQQHFRELFSWFTERAIEAAIRQGLLGPKTSESRTLADSQEPEISLADVHLGDPGVRRKVEKALGRKLTFNIPMPYPGRRALPDITNFVTDLLLAFDPAGTNLELRRELLRLAATEGMLLEDAASFVERVFPPGTKLQPLPGAAEGVAKVQTTLLGTPGRIARDLAQAPAQSGPEGRPPPTETGAKQLATRPEDVRSVAEALDVDAAREAYLRAVRDLHQVMVLSPAKAALAAMPGVNGNGNGH